MFGLFWSVSVSGRNSEDAVAKQEETKNRHECASLKTSKSLFYARQLIENFKCCICRDDASVVWHGYELRSQVATFLLGAWGILLSIPASVK